MNDIELQWELGTAYDFFISLEVIHNPTKYGLRASWAAGVRSRLPVPEREILQRLIGITWPLLWVHALPEPRNSQTLLATIEQLAPDQRLPALVFGGHCSPDWSEPLLEIADRGSWTEDDAALLISLDKPKTTRREKKEQRDQVIRTLEVWANASEFEDGLAAALRAYQDNFFAEEEMRILPALKAAIVEAQELAEKSSIDELMLNLSQGILVTKSKDYQRLVMVPSFWSTPFMLFFPLDEESEIRVFGARPANASLVPGEVVPDALHQALKTLADPTRLKIFRYLSEEALSPAELARRLRLRPPTVIHHLNSLRLARLVQVTISYEGRRYSARPEAIQDICAMLEDFVHKEG